MENRSCLNCGKTFQVPYPSAKRKCCSPKCTQARKRLPRATRADKGVRKTQWVTLTCPTCGERFAVPPFEVKHRKYCSPECRPSRSGQCQCGQPILARNMCRRHYDEWALDRPGKREEHAAYMREYRQKNLAHIRAREWRLNLKKYGTTPEEWLALYARQGEGCALCGERESANGHRLVVDHCHESGQIRGLLCHSCNRAIGLFGDDPARLRAAAEYLEV